MRLPALLLLAATLAAGPQASADDLGPFIAEPKGEQCVEPTQVMRERHWEFILHQRDETVHEGIRTTRHSLKNCLECHVRADAEGRFPRASNPRHFCTSCHIYASVRIDCFECHADRPQAAYSAAPDPVGMELAEMIRRHDALRRPAE